VITRSEVGTRLSPAGGRARRPALRLQPLHRAVRAHWSTFIEAGNQRDAPVPRFVRESVDRYLGCGILSSGFARFVCGGCRAERLVPLSCKTRGLCPSCGGRRMQALAQHHVDAVIPRVPVRQWVLSLPHALRYRLAYDHKLCSRVLACLQRALRKAYRRGAARGGNRDGHTGALTFIQRFGGGLNLNVHFHVVALDGTFHELSDGELRFIPCPPEQRDVEATLLDTFDRILRLLTREGLLPQDDPEDPLAAEAPVLAACYGGSVSQRLALGPAQGRRVIRLGAIRRGAEQRIERKRTLGAHLDGFDLHAAVAIGADQRDRLEHLLRYCARPPLSAERLEPLADGRYRWKLKRPWSDGTCALRFDPVELMERLAALIPPPRQNLVRYHGVLAPNAKLRSRVVGYVRPRSATRETSRRQSRAECERWSVLMQRTFGLDVLECPRCGGRFELIATILDPSVAKRVLEHLKLPSLPLAQAPPKDPPPFWFTPEQTAHGFDA